MQNNEYIKLWVDLVNVKDAISKLRQRELKPYNISPEQTGILFLLTRAKDDPTPADLSRLLIRDPSSVTIMLNRMEARGLVKKSVDANRKNLVRVSITAKGREIYSKIMERICIYRILSGLSDEQCQQLQTCLDILLTNASSELKDFLEF